MSLPTQAQPKYGQDGVLRATYGMPRPLRSKGHTQKENLNHQIC
ncbi:MAG: hypothetical protein NZ519_00075 [Bacteroidia bacterium]|nr:hypothetical protein [Bacteroidia bacterium]